MNGCVSLHMICYDRGVSMLLGWQEFQGLQIVGFALLLAGTCVYNKIIKIPCCPAPVEPGSLLHIISWRNVNATHSTLRRPYVVSMID
jgi:hypothetical protein